MAKAVQKVGLFKNVILDINIGHEKNAKIAMEELTPFLTQYREKTNRLSSFVLSFNDSEISFNDFETYFWNFLASLRNFDKKFFKYDRRVSSNPYDSNYSFSLQGEAFFILMLHPNSPRLARQTTPSIVFNPHQQFERMRESGVYARVRNIIRKRDVDLQGNINPALKDFGEKSEVLQYSGTLYNSIEEIINLCKGISNDENN